MKCNNTVINPGPIARELLCSAQVVVLSQVLACDATLGYEELYNVQVLRFNGEPVRNLRHLAQLCLACAAPFMRFDLDYDVRCPAAVHACLLMQV